jgi:hypothetical protein
MKKLIFLLPFLISVTVFGQNNVQKSADSTFAGKKCGLAINSVYIDNTKMSISQNLHDLFGQRSFSNNNNNEGMMHQGRPGMNTGNSMMNVSQINVGVSFSPYCKKLGDYNRKLELKFGLSFASGGWGAKRTEESATKAGDVFISPNGTIFSDTVSLTTTRNSYEMNVLGLDVAFLGRTSQERLVSLFAGVGLNMGFSITSDLKTVIHNTQDIEYTIDGYEISGQENNYFNHAQKTDESEIKTANSFMLRVYAPFGLDLRLSKKHKILSKFHIYMQGQLGADYQQLTDGSKNFIRPSVGMGLGLKYKF